MLGIDQLMKAFYKLSYIDYVCGYNNYKFTRNVFQPTFARNFKY